MIIESYVGRTGRRSLLFCWLFTLLVIAAFCDMVANTFNGFAKDGSQIMPNAAAASISLLYMFVAVGLRAVSQVLQAVLRCAAWRGHRAHGRHGDSGHLFPGLRDAVTWRYVVFALPLCRFRHADVAFEATA